MDFIVDQYFPIVDALEDELELLEGEIFGDKLSRESTTRIYELKRELLGVKRAVWPLVDVCNRLTRFDVELIHEDTRPYFRDVYDHVVRINDMIDNARELLTTALEASLSLITVSQNEDTKRLAAWAAILLAPATIGSIYGMNFQNMPELGLQYGYYIVLVMIGAICGLLYLRFKRQGWL
jgi:magnesium transporter